MNAVGHTPTESLHTTTDGNCRDRIAHACVCCGSAALNRSPAVLMPFVAHRALGWAPVLIDESWGLKTIPSGNAYTVCNSLCCSECGFLFLDIRFSDRELGSLYNGYREEEYTALREHYEPGYRQRNALLNTGIAYLDAIEEFLTPWLTFPLNVLDWGGDTGKNTPFRSAARHFRIYDISNKPVVAGAERIDKAAALAGSHDLIVSSNVLEHVSYPADVILEMRAAMGTSTVLYIEVPFEEIVRTSSGPGDLHRRKRHWHEHVNFFNETALRRLLAGCGLEILALNTLNASCVADASHVFQIAARKI